MSPGRPRGFRFPFVVTQHAIWLYARFTLSLRDVDGLLAERGIAVSYETVRAWFARFGPAIARGFRGRRRGPNGRWHLDEMSATIGGRRMYLWRAVDGVEGGPNPGHFDAAGCWLQALMMQRPDRR